MALTDLPIPAMGIGGTKALGGSMINPAASDWRSSSSRSSAGTTTSAESRWLAAAFGNQAGCGVSVR